MFDRVRSFVSYWYLRYLMAWELYMLETWERHTAHGLLLILFLAFMYINVWIMGGLAGVLHSWAAPSIYQPQKA